jgi:membrane associated rhomboid family serine protease
MAGMATPEQTETLVCYRHPGRETAVSCSNCGRPICPDCMVFAAVGIKCPECAGQPAGVRKSTSRVRAVAGRGTGAVVTKALIGVNVAVWLVQFAITGGHPTSADDELFQQGALAGSALLDGEWWRLVTNAFLHANILHIGFNMLMLWWFGQALEDLLGRARYLAIYGISILAGSAGALLLTSPNEATLGASGAVFGILGAGLVLERRNINVFGGAALVIVVFNLAFSFLLSHVSVGGHVGGLVGGMLAVLVMSGFGRGHAVYGRLGATAIASLVGLAVASVVIAYARVRGYA